MGTVYKTIRIMGTGIMGTMYKTIYLPFSSLSASVLRRLMNWAVYYVRSIYLPIWF